MANWGLLIPIHVGSVDQLRMFQSFSLLDVFDAVDSIVRRGCLLLLSKAAWVASASIVIVSMLSDGLARGSNCANRANSLVAD